MTPLRADELIVDLFAGGGGKTGQIRLIGNSVCPGMAEALVRANLGAPDVIREAA